MPLSEPPEKIDELSVDMEEDMVETVVLVLCDEFDGVMLGGERLCMELLLRLGSCRRASRVLAWDLGDRLMVLLLLWSRSGVVSRDDTSVKTSNSDSRSSSMSCALRSSRWGFGFFPLSWLCSGAMPGTDRSEVVMVERESRRAGGAGPDADDDGGLWEVAVSNCVGPSTETSR